MTTDAERIIGLYQRHARAYASARAGKLRDLPAEAGWLRRFLGLLPERASILDLGCGCGEPIGGFLVEAGCALTGIDSAPDLIAICRSRLPQQSWRVADMRSLSLGRTFDGVIAWDSFFHLSPDDQRRMFLIFRAHVGPRGALLFTSGPAHGVAMGVFEGEPLYHASLDGDEYRHFLAESGFAVAAHEVEDPTCGGHTIWLAQRLD